MTSAVAAHRMANLMAGTGFATIPPSCEALKKRLGGQPSSQTHDSTSPAFLILGACPSIPPDTLLATSAIMLKQV
jgi:hypothetical protein